MKAKRRRIRKLAVSLITVSVTSLPVAGFASQASAELVENGADVLIESVLSLADVEITDPELLSELSDAITEADDAGILNDEILDEINLINDETPSTEDLEELIDENLAVQTRNWRTTAPTAQAAFETVRAQFELCRAEGDRTTSECAQELKYQYRFAYAEGQLQRVDEEIDKANGLSAQDRETKIAELESVRAKMLEILTRTQSAVEQNGVALTAEEKNRLTGLITEFQNRAERLVQAGTGQNTSPGSPPNTDTPGNSSSGSENRGPNNTPAPNDSDSTSSNGKSGNESAPAQGGAQQSVGRNNSN